VKKMLQSSRGKFLVVVGVVLLCVIFVALVLPVALFPLRMSVSGPVFHVGDTMSGTVTFANKSGQDVTIVSGGAPCVYVYNLKDGDDHVHHLLAVTTTLKAGDKISREFVYEFTEPGIYIVRAHYSFRVNNYSNLILN